MIASGHVYNFHDLLGHDIEKDDCFCTHHLLTGHIKELFDSEDMSLEKPDEMIELRERLNELKREAMEIELARYGAKGLGTTNPLPFSYHPNLMFLTAAGPMSLFPGYLRPETRQGILVNFNRLLKYTAGNFLFACA